MISDAIINLVQTTVSQELLEFNFSVECNIYNMAESDIETEYSETDNASNYRKGVLGNYVCFRVLRCNGRHVREDEGVEWTDVTCFANGVAAESLSAKSGDISVEHDMVERDNLFTKYSPSSEGFSYWWTETRESEEDDTKPDDFQYAVNFGKYFSAHNWADADFADNTFDYFSNGDSKRDENINYDESEEPSSNSISISYAFHDGGDSRHTYYAEFLVPHIDEEDNVHWEARSYYVYPWDDTIAYHSEYVNGSCELEPSSDIISAEFSNGSSGVDNYRIFVRRLREFDRKKFYRIDFDLRKITDPKGYIITPYADEGGSINPSVECQVPSGGSQMFHIEADNGYDIESVIVDEGTENEHDVTHELVDGDYSFFNVIADHTINVHFIESIHVTYTITADTDGNGSITPNGSIYVSEGSEPSFLITPNEGYFITSVLIDGVEEVVLEVIDNTYVFPPVHADHTIYVTFSSSHVIIAHAEEGGSITPDGNVMVAHHADQTFVITPNAGNETVAIYVDGESIMPSGTTYDTPYTYTFEDVVANHEIWASFKPKQYYVNASVSPTGAGLVNGEPEVIIGTTYGTTIELTAEAHAGYAFENWTENGSVVSTNASLSVLVNDNRTFVAHFTSVPTRNVLAKAKPASGGYTTGSGDYSLGSTATVTAAAAEGWGFVKWTDEDEIETYSTNPSYSFTVNDDVVVYALFIKTTPDRYTITTQVSPAGSGTASGGGEYDDGSQHTLTAIPSANYHFVAWTLNSQVVSTSDTFTITVTGDAVYVACFEIDRYSVTTSVSPNGSGTASGGGEYDAGSSVTITAVAAAGYEFVEWRDNGTSVSSNPQYTFTLASNMNFTAVFQIRSYSISAQVSPAGSGTASGGGSYTHGSSVTLIATAAANYAFVNWTENGSEVSTNDHYAFTANADRVVVANFVRVYTINVVSDPAEGGVTHGGGQYASGATASIWVTPNVGFNNPQWLDGYGMADVPRNVVVTGDATYTAYYKESMKHIVADVNPSGSGKLNGDNPPLDGNYAMGESVTIEATPTDDNNYQFYRWTEGGTEVDDNAAYTFQPVMDRNLIANFKSCVTLMVGHIVNGEFYEDGSRATVSPSNSVFIAPNGNQSFNVVVSSGKNYGITQIIDVTTGSVLNLNQHPTSFTYMMTNVTSPHKIRVVVEQQ